MPKYAVPMEAVASTIVYVEADSPDEAREMAQEFPSICARCSGWGSSENDTGIEIGDWYDTDEEPWEVDE